MENGEMGKSADKKHENKTIGIIMALTGGILWGCSGVMGSYLFEYNGFDAKLLVTCRLMFAGLVTVLFIALKSGKQVFSIFRDRRSFRDEIIFSFIGMLPCQLVYFLAVQVSNPSTATVLQGSAPILVLLFYIFVDKRMPSRIEVLVLVLVMTGAFLITTHGNLNALAISRPALIFGFGAALSAAIYNVQPGRILARYGAGPVTGWAMLISGICMIPFSHFWDAPVHMDVKGWLCFLGVIIFGTVVAQAAYMEGVRILGAVQGSLFETVEPVVSTILTVAALGMTLTLFDYTGTVLILLGVILLALFGRRRSVSADAEDEAVEKMIIEGQKSHGKEEN
jgi:drug/metabolite transporter (DMT)-like permease